MSQSSVCSAIGLFFILFLFLILLCLLLLSQRHNYHLPCRRVNFYVAYLYAGKLLAPAPIVYIAALATGHFVIVSVSSSHNYIPLAVKRSISAASKAAAITNLSLYFLLQIFSTQGLPFHELGNSGMLPWLPAGS